MKKAQTIADWLETRWVTPAYSGWLLGSLSIFFFMAATNTMAGWLYVLSGTGLALLAIAAILPERLLRQIKIHRQPIAPISVGDRLTVELVLENPTNQPRSLLQVQDILPYVLGSPASVAIESIPAHGSHTWVYFLPIQHRGVYRWQTVQLRTAAPLGLFWCRREREARATAIVYPTILPLTTCPLVDEIGRNQSLQFNSDRRTQTATEGITRSLRPYRWGDPIRLVHWRTSARYGELRVRELEVLTGGQELVICLDSALNWTKASHNTLSEDFEQAVIAAASLYFYAQKHQLNVQLWTAGTHLVKGNLNVLETLAAISCGEKVYTEPLPSTPLIWLTQNPLSLSTLPPGSRWMLWQAENQPKPKLEELLNSPGIVVERDRPLQIQLQGKLSNL